jgi:hypothetical protein
VGLCERSRDLLDLIARLFRAEVDRGADGGRAHVPGLLDGAEHPLVVGVRVGQELVVVELDDEGDLVGVLAGATAAEDAEGAGDGVAAALDRELDDLLGVEVVRVRGERRAGRVLDALVDGQDREIAGAREAAVVIQPREAVQDAVVAGQNEGCFREPIDS